MTAPTRSLLITGITGQDGSYLAEQSAAAGYDVVGLSRTATHVAGKREEPIDLDNLEALTALFVRHRFTMCFHLAAESFVADCSPDTARFAQTSTRTLLAAARQVDCRFLFAGSCLMFGAVDSSPQNEQTPFRPEHDYGRGKVAAHGEVIKAREHGQFACTAILYNHESERRPDRFVSRTISRGVAAIAHKKTDKLVLGRLDSRRDWGYAPEYTAAMLQMLQNDIPKDLVLASGKTHSVQDLAERAFARVGLRARDHVESTAGRRDSVARVDLCGDATLAQAHINFHPKVSALAVMDRMVDHDMATFEKGATL